MPIVNIHVPKNRTPKYVRQKLTEMEKYNLTIIKKKDFNAPLLIMGRGAGQKTDKETKGLNRTVNQPDQSISRTLHPNPPFSVHMESAGETNART